MDIPPQVKERAGSVGEGIYKSAFKAGRLDGQKVSQDKFAIEVNQMGSAVIKAKSKEGYKAPSTDDLGRTFQQVFKIGAVPDRNAIKKIANMSLKVLDGMPPVPPKPKPTNPSS